MNISVKLIGVPGLAKLMDEEKFTVDMVRCLDADFCDAGHQGQRAFAKLASLKNA